MFASGCATAATPAATTPAVSYAGAPTDDPATSPGASATSAPPSTAAPEAGNPAIDDVVQFAAINGEAITGAWQGGCRSTPSVGVAGMTWYGSGFALSGGGTLGDLRVDATVSGSAADGRPNVEHWQVTGTFGDGTPFDSSWAPGSRGSLLDVSSSEGVLVFAYRAESTVASFDLRVYCN